MSRLPLAMRPRIILRAAFVVVFVGLSTYMVFFSGLAPTGVGQVKHQLAAYGVAAPAVAIGLHIVSVLFLIPGFLMVLATALVFGLDSIWISMIGQTAGSLMAYSVARLAGRDVLHSILGQRVIAVERMLERKGYQYLLYLRLMAIVPLPFLAFGPGLVRVPLRQFLVATIVGQAPSIIVLAVFGDSLAAIRRPSDMWSPVFLVPAGFLIALMVLPLSLSVLLARRRTAPP